jgi:hypothetical protein
MGWSDIWSFTKDFFTSDVAADVASTAASVAATYVVADFMAGGGGAPTVPTMANSPADIMNKDTTKSVADAASKADSDAKSRRGHKATILTGPMGLINDDDEVALMHAALLGG